MKKRVSVAIGCIVIVLLGALAGCNSNTPAAGSKPILLRVGYILTPGSDADKAAQKFKENVEKNSSGRIQVQTFPSSQLGSEQDMLNSLQMGSLEMEISGDGPLAVFEPAFGALIVPFAFRDEQHMLNVYNGPIGQQLNQALIKDKGVRLLAVWTRGPRYLTANKEIKNPTDLSGYKVRVPDSAIYVAAWKQLGAAPTGMNLAELYTALQQGVVQGQENPLNLIYTQSYFQVQKYIMETKHVYGPYLVTISDKVYTGLPADLKKVVDDALTEATAYEKSIVATGESQLRADLEKKGVKFVAVDRQAFINKMKGLPERLEISEKWIPGQYKQLIDTK